MQLKVAKRLAATLSARSFERFSYFKDLYALKLLARACAEGCSVGELKRSAYASLLRKPVVRRVLAQAGGGRVTAADFVAAMHGGECFPLSFDEWGDDCDESWCPSYDQTSRPAHNVVLQVGFPESHAQHYRQLLRPLPGEDPFACVSHPNSVHFPTMGWARIDLSADGREALIEEVQSDWMNQAEALRRDLGCDDSPLPPGLAG